MLLSGDHNLDKNLLEELIQESDGFLFDVELVNKIKAQLESYEWKAQF